MKKTIWLFLASIIILAGCSAQATETVVPAAGISSRTTTLPVTEHPSSTPPLNLPPTHEPTQTPDPSLATRIAALDSCRGNGPDRIDGFIEQAYSVNRIWSATVCQDDGIYTRVAKLGKDKVWKIPALDTDESTSGPDWIWEPYLWSVDGDYLYLKPRYMGFIDSPWLLYSSGFGLLQLDLATGARNVLLKPYDAGYSFALSEDGRLYAYLTNIPRTINILDIKTKEKQQISFKEKYKILQLRWTSDGARLIILTEESAEDPALGGFSIFVYNLEKDTLTKLVDKNNLNSLYSSAESDEPRIYISDLSNEVLSLSDILDEGYFDVNLRTGQVIQVDGSGTPVAAP